MLRGTYWSLGDYLVITDLSKATVAKKWDGSTFSTLTTGLGASLYAKYGVVHQGRVWLANVTTSTDTPHDPKGVDRHFLFNGAGFLSSIPGFEAD